MHPAKTHQTGDPPNLIRVFAVRMKNYWVRSYQMSTQQGLWSDWSDAQAELSLRWEHRLLYWFCHAAAQIFKTVLAKLNSHTSERGKHVNKMNTENTNFKFIIFCLNFKQMFKMHWITVLLGVLYFNIFLLVSAFSLFNIVLYGSECSLFQYISSRF